MEFLGYFLAHIFIQAQALNPLLVASELLLVVAWFALIVAEYREPRYLEKCHFYKRFW